MPITKGKAAATKAGISKNIREFHTGKTFAHTAAKFGKDKANAQAVAVAMNAAGKSKPKRK